MSEENVDARPLTSVELLDAAVWREIDSAEAQPAGSLSRGATIALGWALAHGALRRPWNGCCDRAVQSERLYRTPGGSRMEKLIRCYRYAIVPSSLRRFGDRESRLDSTKTLERLPALRSAEHANP